MGKAHQKDEKGLACLRVEIPPHPFLAWCLLFCFFLPLLFDQGLLDEPPSPLNIFCEPLLDKSLTLLYNTHVRSHTSIAVIPTSTIQYPRLIRYSPPSLDSRRMDVSDALSFVHVHPHYPCYRITGTCEKDNNRISVSSLAVMLQGWRTWSPWNLRSRISLPSCII